MFKWLKMLYIRWRFPVGSKLLVVGNKKYDHYFNIGSVVTIHEHHNDGYIEAVGISKTHGDKIYQTLSLCDVKPFSR